MENNKYYNSIRDRRIKESLLAIFTLAAGLYVLMYILKNKINESIYFEKIICLFERIPLDLRVFLLVVYALIMLSFQMKINFFYFPINIYHIIKLTVMAIYSFYLVVNIISFVKLIKNKKEMMDQWSSSFLYKLWDLINESFLVKSTLFKVVSIIILTIIAGLFIFMILLHDGMMMTFSLLYELLYVIVVVPYILKRIVIFNRILKGTEEMVSGNLSYSIEEGKEGKLSELAHNVNNIKEGFKKSVDSQVKSERLKSELITNVSHDLKTPLTSIINYINLLKNEDLSSDERNSYIEVLDRKSQRLKVLIEDLFEASKMASGAVELNLEKVDIVALLKQTMGEYDEKIKNSNLTFKINTSEPNIYANLDGKKTWRVFENLIGNILKYSQPDTRVYIDIVKDKSSITISMKNISSYEMDFDVEEIFERFKRGDKSRNTEGSGLGLAIAKSIVELQGGKLSIELDGDLFKSIIKFQQRK